MSEEQAEQILTSHHMLLGRWTPEKIGKTLGFFATRYIFLDCRGTLKIHPTTHWGWYVTVITLSHDVSGGEFTMHTVDRPVAVDEHAWICSKALLYNCHVCHHGIVACGAVVRNMTVESYTVVEGNPARVSKRFVDGRWVKA